jgi:hypothetical protein
MYVGQSGREIGTRYKEHIRYICNNNPASAYSQHILNHNHEFGPATDPLQLLKRCSKGKVMNCWETLFIQKLNQKPGLITEQNTQESNPLYTVSCIPASAI